MKEKIEVGDTVKLRDDLTIGRIRKKQWESFRREIGKAISENDSYVVKGFVSVGVEGMENKIFKSVHTSVGILPVKFLQIIEKAPKTLYFDARKMTDHVEKNDVPLGEWKQGGYMECHGLKKEEALKRYSWVGEMFTTEKPEPLQIIDGVVK